MAVYRAPHGRGRSTFTSNAVKHIAGKEPVKSKFALQFAVFLGYNRTQSIHGQRYGIVASPHFSCAIHDPCGNYGEFPEQKQYARLQCVIGEYRRIRLTGGAFTRVRKEIRHAKLAGPLHEIVSI